MSTYRSVLIHRNSVIVVFGCLYPCSLHWTCSVRDSGYSSRTWHIFLSIHYPIHGTIFTSGTQPLLGELKQAKSNVIFFVSCHIITRRQCEIISAGGRLIWYLWPYGSLALQHGNRTCMGSALEPLRYCWNCSQGVPIRSSVAARSQIRFMLFLGVRIIALSPAFDALTEFIRTLLSDL